MQNSDEASIRIRQLALAIINDEIDPVTAARLIVDLRLELSSFDAEWFDFFVAFVSETDTFPDQQNRVRYSQAYLERSDQEKRSYVALMSQKLKEACHKVIGELTVGGREEKPK